MKRTAWAASVLLLAFVMLLSFGCSEEKSTGTPPPTIEDQVGSVQIILSADTIRFLPGDSAQCNVTVIVLDKDSRVLPGVPVTLTLANNAIGFIEWVDQTLRDTTNSLGRTNYLYRSFGQAGDNIITAAAGSRGNRKTDSKPIVVQQAQQVVASLDITLSRPSMLVPTGGEDTVLVTVRIRDSDGQAVDGVSLRLRSPQCGRFDPLPQTVNGRATTVWYSNGEYGTCCISVTAGALTDTACVTVNQLAAQIGSMLVSTDVRNIRADVNLTCARIHVELKDPYGVGIVGDTLYFGAPRGGSIVANTRTDSTGAAEVRFCGGNTPSTTDSAMVVVRYLRWQLAETLRYWIDPAAQINEVGLRANSYEGTAGIDSTALIPDVRYEDGSLVSGLLISYFTNCGQFTYSVDTLVSGRGMKQNFYRFCPTTTDASNRALVWAMVSGVTSDTLSFDVNPGPPRQVDVRPTLTIIDIGQQLPINVLVMDSLRNLVRGGQAVMCSTSLGTLSPPNPVSTGPDGIAMVTLNPGTTAGQAIIKATIAGGAVSDSDVVTVRSGSVASIRLDVSNPSPQVRGTGGQDWTTLQARAVDSHGNPVPDGLWVTFRILDSPGNGANINNRGLLDSAQTASGLALATFNSGTRAGPVIIEVSAIVDGQVIRVQVANISIVSGPPDNMDIQPTNIGVDQVAAWDVQIAALVRDVYNNPVRNGIAVFFDVEPDTAQILSDTVVTGNGPGLPGVAYTWLRYISAATNQTVQITARTASVPPAPEVSESILYTLPIQTPAIALTCDPSSWHFTQPGQGDPCYIECRAYVTDGHGWPINNARVNYSVTRGILYTTRTGNIIQFWNNTGIGTFSPGRTSLWLRSSQTYIFPSPDVVEINGDVQVEVDGFPDALDSQVITFRRGQGLSQPRDDGNSQ